jgi:hypothetical protein
MRTMTADDAALRRLVDHHVISVEQAEAVHDALEESRERAAPARWLAEVAAYLGGVFLLGGAALLVATTWDELTDLARGAVLAGAALVLAGTALAVAAGPAGLRRLRAGRPGARRRVVGVLFALAAAATAGAAGILADGHAGVSAAAAGLLVAAAGYAALPTAPGLLTAVLASAILGASATADFVTESPFGVGLSLVLIGSVWVALALVARIEPQPVALGAGVAVALFGAQQLHGEPGAAPWAYGLTAAIGLACFALYRLRRAAVLLVLGVAALAVAAPEAVWDWTGGAAGGAVLLLGAGAALLVAGALGLGLWRRFGTMGRSARGRGTSGPAPAPHPGATVRGQGR